MEQFIETLDQIFVDFLMFFSGESFDTRLLWLI